MAEDFVWLERDEPPVLPPRVLELFPLAADARHARQRASHPRRPLAAAHDDAVAFVIKPAHVAAFERGEERHGDGAVGERLPARLARRQLDGRAQRRHHDVFGGRRHALLFGEVPEAVARVAPVHVAARAQADPDAARRVVSRVEPRGRAQESARRQILFDTNAREVRRVETFGRAFGAPLEGGEPLRGVAQGLLLVLHVVDEVFPDVVDGLDVIAALLRGRVAAVPAEAHERHRALDAQARLFETRAPFGHRGAGAYRVVDEDDRLGRVNRALDELERAVGLALLADEQAAQATARLQHARLKDGDGRESVGGDLARVEAFEQFERAAAGQLRAARRERHRERVEHPAGGGAVAREHGLRLGAVENAAREQKLKQLGALRVEAAGERVQC